MQSAIIHQDRRPYHPNILLLMCPERVSHISPSYSLSTILSLFPCNQHWPTIGKPDLVGNISMNSRHRQIIYIDIECDQLYIITTIAIFLYFYVTIQYFLPKKESLFPNFKVIPLRIHRKKYGRVL